MSQFEYIDLTRHSTSAFLLASAPDSLDEFCGPCAIISLSPKNFSNQEIGSAMQACVREIEKRLFVNSELPEIHRWLFKVDTQSEAAPPKFAENLASFFKANGTILAGFNFEPDLALRQELSNAGIVCLSNLNLDDTSNNSSGTLICGPLKINEQSNVPCRVLLLV